MKLLPIAVAFVLLAAVGTALAFSPAPRPMSDVCSLAFSPDGRLLASAGWDATVRIWDVASGGQTHALTQFAAPVRAVAFHPSGATLATASGSEVVTLSTRTWRRTGTFRHGFGLAAICYDSTGRRLADAATWALAIWDAASGKLDRKIDPGDITLDLHFAGAELLSADWGGRVRAWSPQTGKLLRSSKVNRMDLRSIDVSPDGKLVACGGWGQSAGLLDAATFRKLRSLDMGGWGEIPVRFSPNGKVLAAGREDGAVVLWEVPSGRKIAAVKSHTGDVVSLAFSPDGKLLASGGEDGQVRIWRVPSRSLVRVLKGHKPRLWRQGVNRLRTPRTSLR